MSFHRAVTFAVRADGSLERTVLLPDGRSYVHACSVPTLEEVAAWFDDHPGEGATLPRLREALQLPFTQVAVALDFILDYGLVVRAGKRTLGCSPCVFEDAMAIYYHAKEQGLEAEALR